MTRSSYRIFWVKMPDGPLQLVSAPSLARASVMLGITPYLLKTYGGIGPPDGLASGSITASAQESPEGVFEYREGIWQRLDRAAAGVPSPTRLSGKKYTPVRVIKLTEAEKTRFAEKGGVIWLREALGADNSSVTVPSSRPIGIQHSQVSVRLSDAQWHQFLKLGGIHWLRHQLDA